MHFIVCDCSYKWPNQRRPYQERVRAVAQQIYNFTQRARAAPLATKINRTAVQLVAIGNRDNLKPIFDQYNRICSRQQNDSFVLDEKSAWREDRFLSSEDYSHNYLPLVFCVLSELKPFSYWLKQLHERTCASSTPPAVTKEENIEALICDLDSMTIDNKGKHEQSIIYLSPDAKKALDARYPPPSIVIVGMIVDRRIARGKSKYQSEAIGINSYQLPMSVLQQNGLHDDEPLNIDTVLDLMGAWWENATNTICNKEDHFIEAFIRAAQFAMKLHHKRHPNRTLHNHLNS